MKNNEKQFKIMNNNDKKVKNNEFFLKIMNFFWK